MTVFETIANCREKMKTMYLKRAFWWYLKRFGTAIRKKQYMFDLIKGVEAWRRPTFHWKCENKDGNCCILTLFETIFWNNKEKNENKDSKWSIQTVFKTILKCREHFKNKDCKWCIRTFKRAVWHYLKRYLKLHWEKQYMFDLIKVGVR